MSNFIPWPTKKDISECAWKVLEKGALELGSVLVLAVAPASWSYSIWTFFASTKTDI